MERQMQSVVELCLKCNSRLHTGEVQATGAEEAAEECQSRAWVKQGRWWTPEPRAVMR